VALPPPAGTPSPPAGGLKKLKRLDLESTEVSDAGCATVAAALDSGALPAPEELRLVVTRASAAAKQAARTALVPGKVDSCSTAFRRGVSQVRKSLVLQLWGSCEEPFFFNTLLQGAKMRPHLAPSEGQAP
jgi:hypothetical protein